MKHLIDPREARFILAPNFPSLGRWDGHHLWLRAEVCGMPHVALFVALHELGHANCGHNETNRPSGWELQAARETEATEWAIAYMVENVEALVERFGDEVVSKAFDYAQEATP